MLMGAMDAAMDGVDVFITPSYGGSVLLTTNLTGHPAVTVPNGFTDEGTPVSISFIGQLFAEAELLRVAKAFQDATGYHLKHPPEFS
jgi:Asp-tRNA(Asn)/Glu-tRNA(Gln) amidotransferase A subunit family amidase